MSEQIKTIYSNEVFEQLDKLIEKLTTANGLIQETNKGLYVAKSLSEKIGVSSDVSAPSLMMSPEDFEEYRKSHNK